MIVFLDIDGVLNTHEQNVASVASPSHCHSIDRECMENLSYILTKTGAFCVLTSAWRYRLGGPHGIESFEFMLRTHGFPEGRLIGYTCRDEEIAERGLQIMAWLDGTNRYDTPLGRLIPSGCPYVVLDDLSPVPDVESMAMHPLVTTNCHVGLTYDDALKAIALLQRNRRIRA